MTKKVLVAIAESATNNEIVNIEGNADDCQALSLESEDCVSNGNDMIEYWGTDEDGDPWRVHLQLGID